MDGKAICLKCGETWPIEEFTRADTSGKYICRTCEGESLHGYSILKLGCSPELYAELYEKQQGRCAICGTAEGHRSKTSKICKLAVDHDHETGEVRGLLCNGCNRGIGRFKDSPELLRAAARYLERK